LRISGSGQGQNQEIVFKHLEHIIMPQLSNQHIVHEAAAQAFIAVFHKNRVLASRFDDKMCTIIFGCIKTIGRKPAYLRCLAAICCPKGIPIKRNQLRVLHHLTPHVAEQEGDVELLPLYVNGDGLALLRHLMENDPLRHLNPLSALPTAGGTTTTTSRAAKHKGKQTIEPQLAKSNNVPQRDRDAELPFTPRAQLSAENQACPIEFYQETLTLLAECAVGNALEVEKVCRQLVPIEHCGKLITAQWCGASVKLAAMRFLRESYYDIADPASRKTACLDPSSWVIIQYMRETLVKVVARAPETYCDLSLYGVLVKGTEEGLVVETLKTLTLFINRCYKQKLCTTAHQLQLSLLADILIRMFSEGGLPPHVNRS
jgi:hypothetical protein